MNNKAGRRGIVLSFSGHEIPESVIREVKKTGKLSELYVFELPVSFNFEADPKGEINSIFQELDELKTEDGISPLSPCSERYVILPTLNILAVLLAVSIEKRCGSYPTLISIKMDPATGHHEFKLMIDLISFGRSLRKSSRSRMKRAKKIPLDNSSAE